MAHKAVTSTLSSTLVLPFSEYNRLKVLKHALNGPLLCVRIMVSGNYSGDRSKTVGIDGVT